LYERVHWYIVVFDGNKAQYMILIHNRMHSIKKVEGCLLKQCVGRS
jgi:hypothetical protein